MFQCEGCQTDIKNAEYLICTQCNKLYDLLCANISLNHVLSNEQTKMWKCQACICSMPKRGNSNISIRSSMQDLNFNESITNITLRRKTNRNTQMTNENEQSIDDIIGDTMNQSTGNTNLLPTSPTKTKNEDITLESISNLLDAKFAQMKFSLLEDVKNTIQQQLNTAILNLQNQVEQTTSTLTNEQKVIKEKITIIDKTIENIKNQLHNLKDKKKFVLYGLTENHQESEYDLINRVSRAFHEIMDININPYIEELKRIGKRGDNRPLAIEIMNKRMTKYIIENARTFHNSGLTIAPFMDSKTLKQRNELRENLRIARENGDHAIIRNQRLYINGKDCTVPTKLPAELSQYPSANHMKQGELVNSEVHRQSQIEVRTQTQIRPQPMSSTQIQKKNTINKPFRY